MAEVELSGVTKAFSGQAAVSDVSFSVAAGHLVALLGPSGCGKSTTLRLIAGLEQSTAGTITISARDVTNAAPAERGVSMVFQNYALFPHMSAAENVAFGLDMRQVPKSEARRRVEEALEMVRLPGYGARKPREMSGGQQQRVALARALVIRPRILLLDEPLSNLDAKLRDDMRLEIREIQQRLGITTVFVTHDQVEALTMCDLVGVMSGGYLAQLGAPEEIYERPASLFVAEFVGRTNVLDCEVVDSKQIRLGAAVYRCAGADPATGKAKAVIRPHRISLTPRRDQALVSTATNSALGRVLRATYIGDLVQYDIDIGGPVLKVEAQTVARGQAYGVGDQLMCEWSPRDMLVFGD